MLQKEARPSTMVTEKNILGFNTLYKIVYRLRVRFISTKNININLCKSQTLDPAETAAIMVNPQNKLRENFFLCVLILHSPQLSSFLCDNFKNSRCPVQPSLHVKAIFSQHVTAPYVDVLWSTLRPKNVCPGARM